MKLQFLAVLICCFVAASCGGGGTDVRSEQNAYGVPIASMQAAPATVTINGIPVNIFSQGTATLIDSDSTHRFAIDPVTGRVDTSSIGTGSTTAWFVSIGLYTGVPGSGASSFQLPSGWSVRTLWLLEGSDIASSRNILSKDSSLFLALFGEPKIKRNGSKVVAELVNGTATFLVSAEVNWSN